MNEGVFSQSPATAFRLVANLLPVTRNESSGKDFGASPAKPASLAAFVLGLAIGGVSLPTFAHAADLCDNWNTQGVTQGALSVSRTNCFLKQAAQITQISTYHWNGGAGAKPGTIFVFDVTTNRTYSFRATGASARTTRPTSDGR